jgi:hypothetical protein
MRRGWIFGGLGAALLAAVLLVPAATGAGPFHSGSGTTKYLAKINGSTSPTFQCTAAGTFNANVQARVDTPGSGSLTTNKDTDAVNVTVPPPAGGSVRIIAPNQNFPGTFNLPCPAPQQSTSVTFTFTPQICTQKQGNICLVYTDQNLAVGTVVATITNTASA